MLPKEILDSVLVSCVQNMKVTAIFMKNVRKTFCVEPITAHIPFLIPKLIVVMLQLLETVLVIILVENMRDIVIQLMSAWVIFHVVLTIA